jgi:hypothetical protein
MIRRGADVDAVNTWCSLPRPMTRDTPDRAPSEQAVREGVNPNVWYGNVEHVAVKAVGWYAVQYIGPIYKYYRAYGRGTSSFS